MLELSDFKRAGKFEKATSWIVDPMRSLMCSFLWPYFKLLLAEIEQRTGNVRLFEEALARQAQEALARQAQEALARQAQEALARQAQEALARQAQMNLRLGSVQKDFAATATRLASVEKLLIEHKTFLTEYKDKTLQLDNATAARLASVEKLLIEHQTLLTEYMDKTLQLDDGAKVAFPGSSLILAAVKHGRFLLRHPDLISQVIMDGKYWDPHLEPIIENVGRQDLLAIDAGAYLGFHSIHMARHFGQVYSFEPQTEMFEMLCANILINGMKNIKAFNNALYERECYMRIAPASMQEIAVPYKDATVDYDRIGNAAALAFAPADEESVSSIRGLTIDSLNLENVGLIKIDTQGCEFHVLKGAAKTIERCRPVIIFEHELQLARAHGWGLAECEEFFKGLYYDLKLLATQVEGKQSDYLATPRPEA
jgi:FkbM family methyltransferase